MQCMINNLPIYYEEFGQGKPILCIHGFPENHLSMKGCFEPFFKDVPGYRRIYLDMPGMGKSPGADWIKNADDMLDVLKQFAAKVIGNEGFLLTGFSYGGYMALGMAHDTNMKIDGMFLFGPATVTEYEKRKLPDSEEMFVEKGLKEAIAGEDADAQEIFFEYFRVATKETWQRFMKESAPAYMPGDDGAPPAWATDFIKNYRENGYAFSFEPELKELQFSKPVTVLTGRLDNSTGYEDPWDLLNHLPYLTFVVLDGVGHFMQIENSDAFNFHVRDWLKAMAGRR